jgi:hypothetical protein
MIARILRTGAQMAASGRTAPADFASASWMRIVVLNHRFDKLGNPLPLELHGCGCGLCARQQRAIRHYFLTGSPQSHGEASDFVGMNWEAR